MKLVAKEARDQREGVSSGVIPSWRRRRRGEAAEKVVGRKWYRAVGNQRLAGKDKEGSWRRF